MKGKKSKAFREKAGFRNAVRARLQESEATAHLGLDVESVSEGRAVFSMDVKSKHRQMHGVVHGGILASLADTTAAIAAYTTVPQGTEIATVELKINYLEPVPGGRIKASARVLRTGRNFVVTECEIYNESGVMAAKALLTFGATAGHSMEKPRARRLKWQVSPKLPAKRDYSSPPWEDSSPSL